MPEPLRPPELAKRCDGQQFEFETTAELEPLTGIAGQRRAVDAVGFGVDIQAEGFNIFALGPLGTGKRSMVRQFLSERAPAEPAADDWCYVNNFEDAYRPRTLCLPAGEGRRFRERIDQLVADVRAAIAGAFESDQYRERRRSLESRLSDQHQQIMEQIRDKAHERDLEVVQSPAGLAFVPRKSNGEPMPPQELQQLPDDQQEEYQQRINEMQKEAEELTRRLPQSQREVNRQLAELNREVAREAVRPLLDDLREAYAKHKDVRRHLDALERDFVEHAEGLLKIHRTEQQRGADSEGDGQVREQQTPRVERLPADPSAQAGAGQAASSLLRRYRVNPLVDRLEDGGAPVVYEDNPTYQNLVGRVEHQAQMGMLVSDFNLIKAGALHRANGGYLVLDAPRLLMQPLAWEALKRALRGGEIRIEPAQEQVGLISTVTLEPEPVPLRVKVVLMGSWKLYSLLREVDPDVTELFKVPADFEEQIDRDGDNEQLYARLLGTLAQKEGLRPLDRSAVARLIEQSSRLVGDGKKLSMQIRRVADLVREADYWAGNHGTEAVRAEHIDRAVEAQRDRSGRLRDRLHESIQRDLLKVDTSGERAGQVNGLAVVPFGDLEYGRPMRITARIRLGSGEVIDIEREVEMGGPVHSKGVLILSGFLSGRYALDLPLSLSASLVFEQSYAPVGGDSASTAELLALLSAIADVPVRQSIAITGSVNQHGQVQAVGGVTAKIEGFFDVCRDRGLTGEQGVIIPSANVDSLMLRDEVVEAAEAGRFHVWPADTVDQALELVTGWTAGEPDADGEYHEDTLNGRIRQRLRWMAEQRHRYAAGGEEQRRTNGGAAQHGRSND